MAIPAEIANIIQLAKTQEAEEQALENYRTRKAHCQAEITELNTKIQDQIAVVQSARAALKVAATSL